MQETAARLLVVAHGTAAAVGCATTARLVEALADVRPAVRVDLCFLDVATPRLPDAIDVRLGPTVVVPLLLSTGYHVQSDIPAAVDGRADIRVGRHLGPHPLLIDALIDRLGPVRSTTSLALVGAGSSRPEAAAELTATAQLLADRLRRQVAVHTLTDDLGPVLRALPGPVQVATYLLAEGQFVTTLRAAGAGVARVADPIGVHPALVELVWTRYDEALRGVG